MKQDEEQFQKEIESGTIKEVNADVVAYQKVFQAMKKEPDFSLHSSFADKVVANIVKQQEKATTIEYVWLALGVFFLFIALVVCFALTGFKLNLGFLKAIADYKGLFIFAIVFIIFLQFLEKLLIRNRQTV